MQIIILIASLFILALLILFSYIITRVHCDEEGIAFINKRIPITENEDSNQLMLINYVFKYKDKEYIRKEITTRHFVKKDKVKIRYNRYIPKIYMSDTKISDIKLAMAFFEISACIFCIITMFLSYR